MTTHQETAEHHVDKSVGHSDNGGSNPLQNQYQDIMNGAKLLSKNVKDATSGLTHMDVPNIFGNAAKHASSAVGEVGHQLFNDMDKDKNLHYIKHDLCGDDPVKVGIAAVGTVAVAGLGFALFAPAEAAVAATAIGLSASDALPLAAVTSIGGVIALGFNSASVHHDGARK